MDLRFLKQLQRDDGRSFAEHPFALGTVTAPSLEITQLALVGFAILRDHRLPIVITRLPGVDAVGQNVAHRRRLPDLILARGRGRPGLIESFGDLPARELFFNQRAVNATYDLRLLRLDHHLRCAAVMLWQIAIAITAVSPGNELAAPCFFQSATTRAFDNLGAFVLGDHPLHLRQQDALGRITEWVLEKDQPRVELAELLDEEPLMAILASQSVRRKNHDGVEFTALRAVAQPVERRAVEPPAAETIIYIFMFRKQRPVLLLNVLFEQLDLRGYRALLLLGQSRDSGIDRYLHLAPPGVRE